MKDAELPPRVLHGLADAARGDEVERSAHEEHDVVPARLDIPDRVALVTDE